jgi:hypothetical protein
VALGCLVSVYAYNTFYLLLIHEIKTERLNYQFIVHSTIVPSCLGIAVDWYTRTGICFYSVSEVRVLLPGSTSTYTPFSSITTLGLPVQLYSSTACGTCTSGTNIHGVLYNTTVRTCATLQKKSAMCMRPARPMAVVCLNGKRHRTASMG